MAPHPGSEEDYIREKARKDLLHLLETVSAKVIQIILFVSLESSSG